MRRQPKNLLIPWLAGVFLGFLSLCAHSVVVDDLYSAEILVTDNSQQALAVGAKSALAEVLVKISGSTEVLQNPVLTSAMTNARSLVQQYAYISQEADSAGLLARFEFDESTISKLVAKAGIPLWTANRPVVLVWVVVEGSAGKQFLSNESDPEVLKAISRELDRRGVPAQFPLYDLNDAALLSVDDLWRLNGPALIAASQRYGVQDILAGRLATLSNGSGVGDWSYVSGKSRIDRSIRVGNTEDFLSAGVALVAEEMSARYAVAPGGENAEGVKMRVAGVNSYSDYAGIVSWLEGLELIENANIESIRGDVISLNLVAQTDAEQLASIIELNKHLQPVPTPNSLGQLSYQWKR